MEMRKRLRRRSIMAHNFVPLSSRPHSVDSISDIGHGICIHCVEEYNKIPVPWERDWGRFATTTIIITPWIQSTAIQQQLPLRRDGDELVGNQLTTDIVFILISTLVTRRRLFGPDRLFRYLKTTESDTSKGGIGYKIWLFSDIIIGGIVWVSGSKRRIRRGLRMTLYLGIMTVTGRIQWQIVTPRITITDTLENDERHDLSVN